RLTTGRPCPDQPPTDPDTAASSQSAIRPAAAGTPPQSAILRSAEDDPDDTLFPRFLAAGGDPDRVHFVLGVRVLPLAIRPAPPPRAPPLPRTGGPHPPLAPLPPCPSGTHSLVHADPRSVLRPLAAFAARHRLAVLGIFHRNKVGGSALFRIAGSIAFPAAARV